MGGVKLPKEEADDPAAVHNVMLKSTETVLTFVTYIFS
jgi:hypothetical protein